MIINVIGEVSRKSIFLKILIKLCIKFLYICLDMIKNIILYYIICNYLIVYYINKEFKNKE